MYCELKNKEIELYEETQKFGNENKITCECSENYIRIGDVIINSPCPFNFNEKCMQFKYRLGDITT